MFVSCRRQLRPLFGLLAALWIVTSYYLMLYLREHGEILDLYSQYQLDGATNHHLQLAKKDFTIPANTVRQMYRFSMSDGSTKKVQVKHANHDLLENEHHQVQTSPSLPSPSPSSPMLMPLSLEASTKTDPPTRGSCMISSSRPICYES